MKKKVENENLAVFYTTLIARPISVIFSFPFEYRATILYGKSNFQTKVKMKKGMSSMSSFWSIAGRDILFSAFFWPTAEMTKRILRENTPLQREAVVMPLSSIVACFIAGTVSYPWEFVKIMRVSFELEYKGKNFLHIFRDVYSATGYQGVLAGRFSL